MVADLKDLPRRHYTLEEYFALESASETRYEYWGGDIVCMSGGSPQHAIIGVNILVGLTTRLRGGPCRTFNGDLAIRTPALPPYRYPDVSVVCGEPIYETVEGASTLANPRLIVEVLSPATEGLDRNQKKDAYQALPSLAEYILVAQHEPHVTRYVRQGDSWVRSDYSDLAVSIELSACEVRLPLAEIYEGVEFN
ncbi:MAG: Uma2 family endonuclease [Acidobacteria bacterium]|nr:Uma2 family endonuclease [Acidobacteriota bacterium]MCW5971438.1 Uma2 family endonuclease [Blastocatellales bacterium]